jgi:alpha-tubulin suppressor-like RCC1 family protein/WD40 repeat protein
VSTIVPPPQPPPPLPFGLVVSDPVLATATATAPTAASPRFSATFGEHESVVYVSLVPGTEARGVTATVRALTSDSIQTTAVLDGGFDPVPVAADVGDTIEVIVRDASGAVVLPARIAVARVRRPIVVRTDPPPKKRDVPLNSVMVVVFSEPIDPAALSATTVHVLDGQTSIAGRLAFTDEEQLMVALVPEAPLRAGTDYVLEVTGGIRDLDSDSLEAPVAVEFTSAAALATTGEISFTSRGPNGSSEIFVMNLDGSGVRQLTDHPAQDEAATWSPDGTRLAFLSDRDRPNTGNMDVYVMNDDGSGVTRLTTVGNVVLPAWSRSGTRIAFHTYPEFGIYVMNADGSDLQPVTTEPGVWNAQPAWSPDGTRLAFSSDRDGNREIYVMNADGSEVTRLTNAPGNDEFPTWSPDGNKIAFDSFRDGNTEIYVMNVDGSAVTKVTDHLSEDGNASWSPDGTRIAFVSLRAGPPYQLFVTNADGSGVTQLTNYPAGSYQPEWSPVSFLPVTSLTVTPESATVGIQETVQLSATLRDASGNVLGGRPVSWTSSDPSVAAVNSRGLITGLAIGSTQLIATSEGVSGSAFVAVKPRPASQLMFAGQPTNANAHGAIAPAVEVTAQDAFGNTDPDFMDPVSIVLGNHPNGGSLAGTTTVAAVAGVARFADLRVDAVGAGHTLVATANGLSPDTSALFTVSLPIDIGLQRVDAGGNHTCGVTTGGQAYCWGDNDDGQLGDGQLYPVDSFVPTPVVGGLIFSSMSAGGHHTCGVVTGGQAFCWGLDTAGQLGDGTRTNHSAPVPVAGGLTFASVSVGADHACGATTDGLAHCWGFNGSGRLGDGSVTDKSTPAPVSGGLVFASLSAGGEHTCGVTTGGQAYCWGDNSFGQLGDGTLTDRYTPTVVASGLAFASVSAGYAHTCGLTTGGQVYCWGWNRDGQLGDGTPTDKSAPTPVTGGLAFASVSAGYDHTCGMTLAGQAYCWGRNLEGQLGDASASTERRAPAPVSGNLTFASVTAGGVHTCGVTTTGEVLCWGWNYHGQLGDGSRPVKMVPAPVPGASAFAAVSAGHVHTCGVTTGAQAECWGVLPLSTGLTGNIPPTPVSGELAFPSVNAGAFYTCGVTTGGQAYCWGLNGSGQLGDGTLTDRSDPVLVAGGGAFASLSVGTTHTCGVTTSGQAYCWGRNYSGELGDGTLIDRPTPAPVSGGLVFTSLAAGPRHTCGVTTSEQAYCWGDGIDSQLGDGSGTSRLVPTPVAGGLAFASLGTGVLHTCGVTPSGQAYCWGRNTYGQLGDGTFTHRSTPALVSGGLTFASVSAESGGDHTCGITTSGQAYCWGRNDTGQLGDGTLTNRSSPVLVSGGLAFVSVSAGGGHTCGVTTVGQAYCWGRNDVGQLGDNPPRWRSDPQPVAGGLVFVAASSIR